MRGPRARSALVRGALRQGLRGFAGGLPRVFWWLWGGMLVNRLGGLVVPYLAIYLTERRGASVAQAGLIASLWGLGSIASGPIGGLLADRVGRRSTLVAALAASGLGMMALGFVERLEVLAPAAVFLGFASDVFRPAMQAAVADLVPEPAARVRAYGLVYWAVNLGFAAALAVAGLLASASFTLLFLLDGATTLAFAAIVLAKVPETRPKGGRHEPALRGLATAFRDPSLLPLLALNFLFRHLWQSHAALPVDMRRNGLSAATYGALLSMNGLAVVVLQPLSIRFLAGRDSGRILALGGAPWGSGGDATRWPPARPHAQRHPGVDARRGARHAGRLGGDSEHRPGPPPRPLPGRLEHELVLRRLRWAGHRRVGAGPVRRGGAVARVRGGGAHDGRGPPRGRAGAAANDPLRLVTLTGAGVTSPNPESE